MVRLLVVGNGSNQVFGLLDDQLLKAVLMVEISVKVLFHGLSGLFVLVNAFVVVFQFLEIDVGNELF